ERQRRLRDDGDGLVGGQRSRLLGSLDDDGRLRPLAERADHLDVVRVPDERDEMPAVGICPGFRMHLVHERAGGVDDVQPAALRVLLDGRRDAVRGENADLALGDLGLVLDEDGAEPLEAAHDVLVVDDLMPDVHRRAVLLEEALDDLDRPVDAGAERPRCGEEDALAAHATLPSARKAVRTSRTARNDSRGEPMNARARPSGATLPSSRNACTSGPSCRPGVSLTARTQPASRPARAKMADSMSTASAPVRRRSRARSAGSSTISLAPRIVPSRAPRTPSGSPCHRTEPDSSTTRVASITVPTGRASRSEPAMPNDTTSCSGMPCAHAIPTSMVRPSRRAARRSAGRAHAKVSPSASTPCSGRSP